MHFCFGRKSVGFVQKEGKERKEEEKCDKKSGTNKKKRKKLPSVLVCLLSPLLSVSAAPITLLSSIQKKAKEKTDHDKHAQPASCCSAT